MQLTSNTKNQDGGSILGKLPEEWFRQAIYDKVLLEWLKAQLQMWSGS